MLTSRSCATTKVQRQPNQSNLINPGVVLVVSMLIIRDLSFIWFWHVYGLIMLRDNCDKNSVDRPIIKNQGWNIGNKHTNYKQYTTVLVLIDSVSYFHTQCPFVVGFYTVVKWLPNIDSKLPQIITSKHTVNAHEAPCTPSGDHADYTAR